MDREQEFGFDLGQRGGQHQEITRKVNAVLLHPFQVSQVLIRDQGNRDVIDIDFVFPD